MTDILDGLTDSQRQAVTHINGPLIVIAGPGSGKTRVITRRIAFLLHSGIHPWNILAITFTNKAAAEMRERVDSLVTKKGVWVSTFHSFCARILRQFAERIGYTRDFTIYDSDDSRSAVSRVMKQLELPSDRFKPAAVRDAISSAKSRFQSPEDIAAQAEDTDDFFLSTVAAAYAAYTRVLKDANAMDFDDLLIEALGLLRTDADALEKLRHKHQFILVDEFQDTNIAQYEIVRMLAEEHRNLCATGDPDQSIYGWRGAEIRNILDFEKDFPEAKTLFLDRNYRSTQTIIQAADAVVAANRDRKERKLYTTNPAGEKIRLLACPDSKDEADAVADAVAAAIADGIPPRDVAVFYRINALSRQIEEALLEHAIPYQIVGGVEFYSRKEVKDVIAYLRVAANPADDTSFLRVINVPSRHIGAKSVAALVAAARAAGTSLAAAAASPEVRSKFAARAAAGLEAFSKVVAAVGKAAAEGTRHAVDAAIGESAYIEMLKASDDERAKDRLDNLFEFVSAAAQFDESADSPSLPAFLEQLALVSDVDNWHDREDRVTLMTIHAAKGLEFPLVFIVGLEESILPHERSSESPREIEEERRIFFVAMTRAKERICLSHASERMSYGSWKFNMPSRFIREIPAELLDVGLTLPGGRAHAPSRRKPAAPPSRRKAPSVPSLAAPVSRPRPANTNLPQKGTRVRHDIFGMGVIKSVTTQGKWHKATVEFALAGTKKLILEKATLEIINT